MANYLSNKEQSYYTKHSIRSNNGKAKAGERKYSSAWLSGFKNVWDNDGFTSKSHCKDNFEKVAFERGQRFAGKVLERK